MLTASRALLSLLTADVLKPAAAGLNDMLDLTNKAAPVSRDELKAYAQRHVKPVLQSTALDKRGNSLEMRKNMCQLVRDASFTAKILRASPYGEFIHIIKECIRKDNDRMHFMSKMTSAQASKIIENLSTVGVQDADIYSALVSRLDFRELKEVARVMFSLSEKELDAINVTVVTPLYCGERWTLTYDNPDSKKSSGCNAFEAVRVLRALSKSVRAVVEQKRRAGGKRALADLPCESVALLRRNLLEFVFENAETLRGAHWINIVRALIHFPQEVSAVDVRGDAAALNASLRACDYIDTVERDAPTCHTIACAALDKVFCYVEHRAAATPTSPQGSYAYPFDATLLDLVKLLPLIRQVNVPPRWAAVARQREAQVLQVLLQNPQELRFGGLAQLLRVANGLRLPSPMLEQIANTAVEFLVAQPVAECVAQVPFNRIVQFSSTLGSLRVKCPAFVDFLCSAMPYFSPSLNVNVGLSFMNLLSAHPENVSPRVTETALLLFGKVCRFHENVNCQSERPTMIEVYPLETAKMLRGLALLQALPSRPALLSCVGESNTVKLTRSVIKTEGVLVFNFTRSLSHFLVQARETGETDVEQLLVQRGLLATTFPILRKDTELFISSVRHHGRLLLSSYAPIAWRSTMELCLQYADPDLSHTTPSEFVARLEQLLPLLSTIAGLAATSAMLHVNLVRRRHSETRGPRQTSLHDVFSDSTNFSSNAVLHYLSFLLMLEYMIFQGVPKVRSKAPDELELHTQVERLRDRYVALISSPVKQEAADALPPFTPTDVVRHVFASSTAADVESDLSSSSSGVGSNSVLSKKHILEITTKLPFPISLVLHPGPINEVFTEFCVPIMIETSKESD